MHAHLAEAVYSRAGAIVGVSPNIAAGLNVVEDHGKERLKFPWSEVPHWGAYDGGNGQAMTAIVVGKAVPCRVAVLYFELAIENVADVLAVLENSDEIAFCGIGDPFWKMRTKIHGRVRS